MELIEKIGELRKLAVSEIVQEKMAEFSRCEDLFSELCFCLMTAGFKAGKCIEIQREIGSGFVNLRLSDLSSELKRLGHRFWAQRAERIFLARDVRGELVRVVEEGDRDWLVANVKGLGMKEASHFLRNCGSFDFAILDFHILDLLEKYNIIEDGVLSRKRYLEIEGILREMASGLGMSLGELDLYLWHIETGKILK